jgi:hypothetical protein
VLMVLMTASVWTGSSPRRRDCLRAKAAKTPSRCYKPLPPGCETLRRARHRIAAELVRSIEAKHAVAIASAGPGCATVVGHQWQQLARTRAHANVATRGPARTAGFKQGDRKQKGRSRRTGPSASHPPRRLFREVSHGLPSCASAAPRSWPHSARASRPRRPRDSSSASSVPTTTSSSARLANVARSPWPCTIRSPPPR